MKQADIPVVGWLIVISGIFSVFSFASPHTVSAIIGPFALRHDIAWILAISKLSTPVSPRHIIVLWTFAVIGCGVGIIYYANIARMLFTVLCVIQASVSLVYLLRTWEAVLINLKFIRITPAATLFELFRTLGPCVIAVAYGVYLSLPNVKEQFEG